MATKLNSTLKRELAIEGERYMLTLTPAGLKLRRKGRRIGHEIAWRDLVSGDAALAVPGPERATRVAGPGGR